MRLLLLFISAGLVTVSAVAQAPATSSSEPVEIVKLEQNLWTTMAEGEFSAVRKLFAADFIQVDEHVQALDTVLIALKHCKIQSYELRDLQVRILSPDSALMAYHVVSTLNCGAADHSKLTKNDNNSVTVWVRQHKDGRWLVQAHTESPAKP